MGIAFGQGGTPTQRVRTASVSDISSLYKAIGMRFTPQSTNDNQAVLTLGGLTLVYNGTAKTFVLTETRAGGNDVYTCDVTAFYSSLTVGTEYNVVIYYETGAASYYFVIRVSSTTSAGMMSDAQVTTPAAGAGAYNAQSGTPSWGNASDAVSMIADTRDAFLMTYPTIFGGAINSLNAFGQGASPFQFYGVTLQSCPGAIGTAIWDRRPGAAEVATVGGTTNVLGLTGFDGPIADIDSAQSSNLTSGIIARYAAGPRDCITTSAGLIVQFPDLSGGGGHLSQTTSANQAKQLVDQEGRYHAAFSNDSDGSVSQSYTGISAAGRATSTRAASAFGVMSASFTMKGSPASSGRPFMMLSSGGSVDWILKVYTDSSTANVPRFGIEHDTSDTPTSQSPRIVFPNTPAPFIVANSNAATADVLVRVNGISAATTQATSATAKYPNMLGRALASPEASFRMYEMFCASTDKTSVAAAIEEELRGRNRFYQPSGYGLLVFGTSTEEGDGATDLLYYSMMMRRTNRKWTVVNGALGGLEVGSARIAATGGSGTFQAGETITQTTSGATCKFLAESDGLITGYDRSGTFTTTAGHTLTGGTSGATRGAPTAVRNPTGSLNDTTFFENSINSLAAYTFRRFVVNTASNGLATQTGVSTTAQHEADCQLATVTRMRLTYLSAWYAARMPQPRTAGSVTAATWINLRNAIRSDYMAGKYNAMIDTSFDPRLNNYDPSTGSWTNSAYYNGSIHWNNTGHSIGGTYADNAITPKPNTAMSRRSTRIRRGRVRN